jgi:hypothetical protein
MAFSAHTTRHKRGYHCDRDGKRLGFAEFSEEHPGFAGVESLIFIE